MKKSRSHYLVFYVFILLFSTLSMSSCDPRWLYFVDVSVLNSSNDNLRITGPGTNLHLARDQRAHLTVLDLNTTSKTFTVSRSSGLCKELEVRMNSPEFFKSYFEMCLKISGSHRYDVPSFEVEFNEADDLSVRYYITYDPECMHLGAYFDALLDPCD